MYCLVENRPDGYGMNLLRLSASIVLFRPKLPIVERALLALQVAGQYARKSRKLDLSLTLVDNSDDMDVFQGIDIWLVGVRSRLPDWRVNLIRAPGNLGYGRGNNLVIDSVESDYHLVANPDLFVREDALMVAVDYMEGNPSVGLLTPAVFGEDGSRRYLCKRNPTLLVMFLRSFAPNWLRRLCNPVMHAFEMRNCDYQREIHPVEYPSGSFMFFRTQPLKSIGGFDPHIFLHYEDADIGRRLLSVARTHYVPTVVVTHLWARDTHKSLRMKWVTIKSGLYYWAKWRGLWRARSMPEVPLRLRHDAITAEAILPQPLRRRVLVTGANGFIGKAVCRYLADEGYAVLAAVRKMPDLSTVAYQSPLLQYVETGRADPYTDWSALLVEVDAVVHLAARVHVMQDPATDPLGEYKRENIDLTLNLARQAVVAGVRRFVFVSSIKVNGESTPYGQPFTAGDVPKPEDAYAISKMEAEQALMTLAADSTLEVTVIRPPLVYGPGVKANFESMMRLLHTSLPLPFGGVRYRRSLVSLDNLVDFIRVCIDHPRAGNEVFLVSDGIDLSLAELLCTTSQALGKPPRLFVLPEWVLRQAAKLLKREIYSRRLLENLQVDLGKNARQLGWLPRRDVDLDIRTTAAAFMNKEKRS